MMLRRAFSGSSTLQRALFAQSPRMLSAAAARGTNPTALCETNLGSFTVELYVDQMPITASNFIDLAQQGYYDGIHFHRVIPNFMAQFGCPNARDLSGKAGMPGTGGPRPDSTYAVYGTGETITRTVTKSFKGAIPDEHTAKISNVAGTLSMANSGPNSGGSQFFINVVDNARLDWFSPGPSKHPVFGKVVEGFDVVLAITEVPTGAIAKDRPNDPVQMLKITVD